MPFTTAGIIGTFVHMLEKICDKSVISKYTNIHIHYEPKQISHYKDSWLSSLH
jgi:hypothetical protein